MTLRLKVYMGPNDQMANKLVETIYNFIGVVAHDLNCAQILSTFSNLKLKRSVETRSFIVKLFIIYFISLQWGDDFEDQNTRITEV